jgi:hypothetical protein
MRADPLVNASYKPYSLECRYITLSAVLRQRDKDALDSNGGRLDKSSVDVRDVCLQL